MKQVLELIRSKRKKVTTVRKTVLEILTGGNHPISVPELLGILGKRGIKINKTTVYRELSFLVSLKLVKEVRIATNKLHYEFAWLDHHHHLVCEDCGKIEKVVSDKLEASLVELERQVLEGGFAIKDHNLEFYGTCAGCR